MKKMENKKTDFDEFLEEQLKDPELKEMFDEATAELDLAFELQAVRNELNISQEELARKTGILQSNLSRFESGRHEPSLPTLRKIARALGCSVKVEIVRDSENKVSFN